MNSQIEHVTSSAIASGATSIESSILHGYIEYILIQVRVAAGTASSNTCTVTVTDNVLGRTLLTATGITGVSNGYHLQVQAKGVDGAAITGVYERFYLRGQRLTFTVASGTDTDYIEAYIQVADL